MRPTAVQWGDYIRAQVKRNGGDPNDLNECLAEACILLSEVAPHISIAFLRGFANGGASPPARSSRHDVDT